MNGVFAVFILFFYQRQSGALIRYRYLLKKKNKKYIYTHWIILCFFYPKRCVEKRKYTCRGREQLYSIFIYNSSSSRRPAIQNYIRSSRRLYYTRARVHTVSFFRITDALTSIGENILFITTLCPIKTVYDFFANFFYII